MALSIYEISVNLAFLWYPSLRVLEVQIGFQCNIVLHQGSLDGPRMTVPFSFTDPSSTVYHFWQVKRNRCITRTGWPPLPGTKKGLLYRVVYSFKITQPVQQNLFLSYIHALGIGFKFILSKNHPIKRASIQRAKKLRTMCL